MRKFNLEQYKEMAYSFNKKNFIDKIKLLNENNDILKLCNDSNWWVVKVIDEDIQNQLEYEDCCFLINSEWDYNEIEDLLSFFKIKQEGL